MTLCEFPVILEAFNLKPIGINEYLEVVQRDLNRMKYHLRTEFIGVVHINILSTENQDVHGTAKIL